MINIIQSTIHLNIYFLVYLSSSPFDTRKFNLNATRPDCWHILDSSLIEKVSVNFLINIAAMEPKRSVFISNGVEKNLLDILPKEMKILITDESSIDKLVKNYFFHIFINTYLFILAFALILIYKKERILNDLKNPEIPTEDLRETISAHCQRRNPMRSEGWIADSLDSSYEHINLEKKFPDCSDELITSDLEILGHWSFTALNYRNDIDVLLRLTFRIFEDFGLLKEFEISAERFKFFLLAVNANYFDNPYHNFCHVVDVLQCCYYLLKKSGYGQLPKLLGSQNLFALLIGCLCHDLGHPSFGNNFLKETDHPLSILFNDSSVLENYHAMVLFSIMRCPLYDWISNSKIEKKKFRKCLLGCVLGTDMSNHFDFIKQFEKSFPIVNNSEAGGSGGGGDSFILSFDEKCQLATALIKCSDISNVLRPFPIAKSWGVSLLNEFVLQGDYERLIGINLGPLNDRKTLKIGEAQNQFLTIVAAPLYRVMSGKIGNLDCFEEWISENSNNWLNFDDSSIKFDK